MGYYEQFKCAPCEHIGDLCEDLMKDSRSGELYKKILISLFAIKETLNRHFIISSLETFLQEQILKGCITKAVDLLEEKKVKEAWGVFSESKKKQVTTFESGLRLNTNLPALFNFLDNETNMIYTGISALDELRVCPARKEFYLLLGRSGTGKSRFLVHLGKYALLQRKKVLHVTLEMEEEKVRILYLQSLFSVSTKEATVMLPILKREGGELQGIVWEELLEKDRYLGSKKVRDMIKMRLTEPKWGNLIIKEFAEKTLSFPQLEAYLDNLFSFHNFTPDIILIDYPDLMDISPDNVRIETSNMYAKLRGLGKERNMAIVAVTQPNRLAEDVKLITRKHVSEDKTKIDISDNVLTLNRTAEEEEKGVARIYVDKSRNERGGNTVLVTQSFALGQFCLDSFLMRKQDYGKV